MLLCLNSHIAGGVLVNPIGNAYGKLRHDIASISGLSIKIKGEWDPTTYDAVSVLEFVVRKMGCPIKLRAILLELNTDVRTL